VEILASFAACLKVAGSAEVRPLTWFTCFRGDAVHKKQNSERSNCIKLRHKFPGTHDPFSLPFRPILPSSEEAKIVSRWDAMTNEWPTFNIDRSHGFRVLRNMESPAYDPFLNLTIARGSFGYDVIMTSELASDIPVLYIGVKDYFEPAVDFEKKIPALMAAISNCNGLSSRLEVLETLVELGVSVHQYGRCNQTHQLPGKLNVDVSRDPFSETVRKRSNIRE
jgi:hypothetical protein